MGRIAHTREDCVSHRVVSEYSAVALVPLSLLPSRGLSPAEYGWNLWPRWGGIPFSDPQISDFAPDANNAQVTVATVPGPAPLLLLSIGLALVVVAGQGALGRLTR
jgi:hypothetical protein